MLKKNKMFYKIRMSKLHLSLKNIPSKLIAHRICCQQKWQQEAIISSIHPLSLSITASPALRAAGVAVA